MSCHFTSHICSIFHASVCLHASTRVLSSRSDALDELVPLIKEAIERKKGNKERVRRRDVLRLALARILHRMAENGVFSQW